MKKIMFNDRYGLTQAVIEGRKTMTRRLEFDDEVQTRITDCDSYHYDDGYLVFGTQGVETIRVKTRYKVGEEVAVAQSYMDAGLLPQMGIEICSIDHFGNMYFKRAISSEGWNNKLFVKSDLMPHRILITGVRCERLQDISDEDCLAEGIYKDECQTFFNGYAFEITKGQNGCVMAKRWYPTSRKAFASLIDKVSGRGTWQRNPRVVVYKSELVK
jgi:hypothetical protein